MTKDAIHAAGAAAAEESPVDAARRVRAEVARLVSEVLRRDQEAERLRCDRDQLRVRLAYALGRDACGQRFPSLVALNAAARKVAAHEGWPDPCRAEQAELDARAHAQLEGQYAAAGGASLSEVAALEGLVRCDACAGQGGSEECGDCDACGGRGAVPT